MKRIRWSPARRPRARLVLVLAFLPGGLAAQSSRSPDLGPFRDSLAAASDNEALRALERSLIVRARGNRSDPGVHIRLGMIALRLGDYSGAVAEFKFATRLAPQWGRAWFGLARAELALGEGADTTKLGRRALLARDAWERSAQAIARAVTTDSSLGGEIVGLVQERLATNRAPSANVVRQGLRRATAARGRRPEALLALGRVEALLGDTTAALAVFGEAAETGLGRGRGLLEVARLGLARSSDSIGVETYYAVAALEDSASVAGLRRDLAWVATAAELDGFDRVSGVARAELLLRFWTKRDRADLRRTGARLREHYRRLAASAATFPNPDDQRVAVFVRHGEPDNRATLRASGVPANESWRYRRAEGDLVVHFLAGADTTNFRIVESLFDIVPADPGMPAGDDRAGADGTMADLALRSRAQLSPFYQAAVAGRGEQLEAFKVREREIGAAGKNLALSTDRFPLRFRRSLPATVQIASLTAAPDSGAVQLLFTIPPFRPDSPVAEGSAIAGDSMPSLIRVRMVVWDSAQRAVLAVDSVVPLVSRVDGGRRGHLSASLAPGWYSSQAALELGEHGVVIGRDDLRVGGEPGEVALSELAIGSARSELRWELGGLEPIVADPTASFGRADTVVISAALIGFAGGESVRVRPRIRPVRSDGREEKWRRWPGVDEWRTMVVGADGSVRVAVSVPIKSVRPGYHEVELEVAGDGDRVARGQARLVVTEAGK